MNRINFSWPDGKRGALTSSWDDGTIHDRRLVDMFNRYGLKASWNLNSGLFHPSVLAGRIVRERITAEDAARIYKGHEIACHTMNHARLEALSNDMIRSEVLEDRRNLEKLARYPVRGLALPFGSGGRRVQEILNECGIAYIRPTRQHNAFRVPDDFMDWTTTCSCADNYEQLWDRFNNSKETDKLFYLWGHSYEIDERGEWDRVERFAKTAGIHESLWHASNIDIRDYVTLYRGLVFSVDMSAVHNSSGMTIWFTCDDKLFSVEPGAVTAV